MARNAVVLCVCLAVMGLFAQAAAEVGPSRLYSSRKLQAKGRGKKKSKGGSVSRVLEDPPALSLESAGRNAPEPKRRNVPLVADTVVIGPRQGQGNLRLQLSGYEELNKGTIGIGRLGGSTARSELPTELPMRTGFFSDGLVFPDMGG